MTGFTVDGAAVNVAGAALSSVVDDLESDFLVVRTQMEQLLHGGWTGAAARSLDLGWQEWRRGYSTSTAGLRAMSRALALTAATYDDAEQATSRHVSAVGGDLR